jgi:hypothetical protein
VDNISVVVALNKRASSYPYVQYLCLLLARLESLYGFQVVGYYINTKRNELADELSRVAPEHQEAVAKKYHPNLERREYGKFFEFLLNPKHAYAETFALPSELEGPAGAAALKEGMQRKKEQEAFCWQGAARGQAQGDRWSVKGHFVELFGGVGTMSLAATRVGMTCLAIVEAHLPSRALALARLEDEKQRPLACESVFEEELMLLNANEVELVLVGPAPRPSGEEPDPLTVGLVQLVEHLRPLLVCVEVVPDGGRLGSSETANELLRLMIVHINERSTAEQFVFCWFYFCVSLV